jgi:hypothetical protein
MACLATCACLHALLTCQVVFLRNQGDESETHYGSAFEYMQHSVHIQVEDSERSPFTAAYTNHCKLATHNAVDLRSKRSRKFHGDHGAVCIEIRWHCTLSATIHRGTFT